LVGAIRRNAQRVADFPAQRPEVTRVIFPGHQEGEAPRRVDPAGGK
jgi:cystathionine beta-lyase/cystathionine gamma-synthase